MENSYRKLAEYFIQFSKQLHSMRIYFICLTFFLQLLNFQSRATSIIDTVESYIQLKIYSGGEDSVFINHPRYFGLFIKDTCSTEDFGTKVLGNLGCWKRVHNNFLPRFWEIGGQSPDNLIGTVIKEIDAINSAAIAAFNAGGDTIEIDSMYLIDRSIFLLSNNTYLGTSDSAGFKRTNPPCTILIDTAKVNDSKILVENNIGFRTYQEINIVNGLAFDSLAGHVSYRASVSNFLGGDTSIFLSGLKIQKQMLPGDSVTLFFPMADGRFAGLDSVYIKNLVFDGNRVAYQYNYDWRTNSIIKLPTTNKSVIENCRFYNITNENIILCGANVINCSGIDLNGSALHFSCNDFDHPSEILYNNFSNTNEIGNELMNHSEAAMTFSAKVQNFRVAYNNFNNINEFGVGIFKNDDRFNEITDNLLNSTLGTIAFQPFYLYHDSNIIYNNKNVNFADSSTENCWVTTPNLTEEFGCNGFSTFDKPFKIGDTLQITFDSLILRNTAENYAKFIFPIGESEYFSLINISLQTPNISNFHEWKYLENSPFGRGLIFDNGHQDGMFTNGNWGYELCADTARCSELIFTFLVDNLPDSTSLVDCPMKGLGVLFDGEMETWNMLPTCQNQQLLFENNFLGQPILEGKLTNAFEIEKLEKAKVFPNPASDFIQFNMVGAFDYQIINSVGKVIKKGKNKKQPIAVISLPNGIYSIKINLGGKQFIGYFSKI